MLQVQSESVIFDNTKIKTFVPEFKAIIPFAEGVKRILKWFDEKPERKFINKETNTKIDAVLNAYNSLQL
ncbi:hypothetical protein [Lutibacter sp. B1]|uniref:hypothetical protein n=1 Tax=Lutibacter sp. B1 TaxID=2725996 RepID=UPI0014568D41|nr:hypothetical protein [Lutibacter sp. B1]NLP59405.1 hypothetical protein [Lutibacter sp. B1]